MPFLDLESLREAIGDVGVMIEILETFRGDASARLAIIEEACQESHGQEVAREVHALKGMALSVGANPLGRCCLELEGRVKALDTAALPAHLASLKTCWTETVRELDRELVELARSAA